MHARPHSPEKKPVDRNSATHSVRLAIFYMSLGTSIAPIMDAIAKHLADSLSPLLITWGRFIFQSMFMATPLLLQGDTRLLWPKQPLVHAARGVLIASATLCFFASLKSLPLADAIAIFFVQPIILTLLSSTLLGEHVGWYRRAAVVLGFLGALLIIRPGSESFSLASLLPLVAAFFYASYLALTRATANIDSPLTAQFASSLWAAVVLTIALVVNALTIKISFAEFTSPSWLQWFWLVAIGAIAASAHLLVVMSMDKAPASLLAPFGYAEIIAATALGWWIFGDWPDLFTWLGLGIICASGLFVFHREALAKTS